jgi:hypothetical protein
VDYHALSYTWGSSDETTEIVLNGQRLIVRKNLDNALRAMRHPKLGITVWTDAICIDQTNIPERNRHLPLMASIYDTATSVISYLGTMSHGDDEDAQLALNLIPLFPLVPMRMDEKGHWIFKKNDNDEPIGVEKYPRLCGACYQLLTRQYFRRVWILQEVTHGSNLTVGCGDNFDLSFDQVNNAAAHLLSMLQRDPKLKGQMIAATPGLHSVSTSELSYVRKLFYFRFLNSRGSDTTGMLMWAQTNVNEIKSDHPGYLETAILARDFEATDSRDKIFALWNLAKDKKGLELSMDYTKSVSQTYEEFAKAWAVQHGSLDIIGAAELEQFQKDSNKPNVDPLSPSWSPNWAVKSKASCLIRRETIPQDTFRWFQNRDGPLYSADGGMKNADFENPLFSFDGGALHATGVIVDRLEHWLYRSVSDEEKESSKTVHGETKEEWDLRNGQFSALCGAYENGKHSDLYASVEQAATAMFYGDVPSAWPAREQHPEEVQERQKQGNFLCDTKRSRHVVFYGGSYSTLQASEVSKEVLRGREPCISENGYMCLAPDYLKPTPLVEQNDGKNEQIGNDGVADETRPLLVAILATCSVPVILVPLEEDDTYQLVGTVFMQGWMEGEGLRGMMDVEDLKEFWTLLSDNGKFTIR